MSKTERKICPCYCGNQVIEQKQRQGIYTYDLTEEGEYKQEEATYYFMQCPICFRTAPWSVTLEEAIEFWNDINEWITIFPPGDSDIDAGDLTEEDKNTIEKLKELYRRSEALKGYCPHEREAMMYSGDLGANYRVKTVAHYGIAWFGLDKRRFPDINYSYDG